MFFFKKALGNFMKVSQERKRRGAFLPLVARLRITKGGFYQIHEIHSHSNGNMRSVLLMGRRAAKIGPGGPVSAP